MKKTVLEMFFLGRQNYCIDSSIPRFVHRHCSTLPPFKVKQLASKLKVSLPKLFMGILACVLGDSLKEDSITLFNIINSREVSLWHYPVEKSSFLKTLKKGVLITKSKNKLSGLQKLAIRFEVKIVKSKILFSFYYPEDFSSDIINPNLLHSYEKVLKEAVKDYIL